MNKTAQIEARIKNALTRLKAVSSANAKLSGKLSELEKARKNDLAELDTLIGELKPLVGED